MFDMHSHILPHIDDGARDIEESIKLLELLKENGVSHVLATPHFYPDSSNFDEYLAAVNFEFEALQKAIENKNLPKVFLGCELLYYNSIGYSSSLDKLCLNNSQFLLLELTDHCINEKTF